MSLMQFTSQSNCICLYLIMLFELLFSCLCYFCIVYKLIATLSFLNVYILKHSNDLFIYGKIPFVKDKNFKKFLKKKPD